MVKRYWVFGRSDLSECIPHAVTMRHSGIVLRLNLALGWGYLASVDRRSTHAFQFEQVEGYAPGRALPVTVGQSVRYCVEGLRVTEVLAERA